jgi:hypothetical protein
VDSGRVARHIYILTKKIKQGLPVIKSGAG